MHNMIELNYHIDRTKPKININGVILELDEPYDPIFSHLNIAEVYLLINKDVVIPDNLSSSVTYESDLPSKLNELTRNDIPNNLDNYNIVRILRRSWYYPGTNSLTNCSREYVDSIKRSILNYREDNIGVSLV